MLHIEKNFLFFTYVEPRKPQYSYKLWFSIEITILNVCISWNMCSTQWFPTTGTVWLGKMCIIKIYKIELFNLLAYLPCFIKLHYSTSSSTLLYCTERYWVPSHGSTQLFFIVFLVEKLWAVKNYCRGWVTKTLQTFEIKLD